MKTFPLVVSAPDGDRFRDDVAALFVRGIEGDLAILAGHTPFVTTVKGGECKIMREDGTTLIGVTDGGILTVSAERVTFLSGSFSFEKEE